MLNFVHVGGTSDDLRNLRGRINPNTQQQGVLKALFGSVKTHLYTDQAAISDTAVNAFITNMMAKTAVTPIPVGLYSQPRNPPRYGIFFTDPAIVNGLDLNETSLEHLCVLTQQLVSAEHNYFTLVGCDQRIKDIGGLGSSTIGTYDAGVDEILSERRFKAILYRDAFSNDVQLVKLEHLKD